MKRGIKGFKRLALLAAAALALSAALAACGGGSGGNGGGAAESAGGGDTPAANADTGEVYTVRIGCATVLPSHPNWFMEELKKALEAKTDRFAVELYPANQLGANAEMIQGLQNGNVQGVVLPSGLFTSIAPIFNLFAVPGLVPDADTQYEMLNNTEVGDAIKAEVSKSGVTPLGFLWCPSQEFYLDRKAESMADLKGLKIRGTDAKVCQDELSAYGAAPVVMSSGDVAMGLQQGTLNGLFTDNTFVAPLKLFEKAKYVVKGLPGVPNSNTVMISNIFLDSLPDDLNALFRETVDEVREMTHEYTIGYEAECYSQIVDGGGTILTPSQAFIDELAEKDAAVRETFKGDNPDMLELYDMVEAWVAGSR
ncbi:MAG: TRAP transporter substrate-binding protein [Clostridiales Family XIII bacterium]|nr:TRAP transporter substrate-binding protein [Clostridiales Family XIII bacterium]